MIAIHKIVIEASGKVSRTEGCYLLSKFHHFSTADIKNPENSIEINFKAAFISEQYSISE